MSDKPTPADIPAQIQDEQPGKESEMTPAPRYKQSDRKGSGRLQGKRAIITGGDSGIGRSVAVLFAREGADVAVMYLDEDADAQQTKRDVEAEGATCLLIKGDVGSESFCQQAVKQSCS